MRKSQMMSRETLRQRKWRAMSCLRGKKSKARRRGEKSEARRRKTTMELSLCILEKTFLLIIISTWPKLDDALQPCSDTS